MLWIPYNQFSDIKKIGKGGFATVYSAIWKDVFKYEDVNENMNMQEIQIIKLL